GSTRSRNADPFTKCIFVRPIPSSQCLIDYDYGRRVGLIGGSKEASLDQRCFQRTEVIWRDQPNLFIPAGMLVVLGIPFNIEGRIAVYPAHRENDRESSVLYPGQA